MPKIIRSERLEQHQLAALARLPVARDPSCSAQRAFDRAFDGWLELDRIKAKPVSRNKQQRRERQREYERQLNKIIRPNVAAASASRGAIHRAALRYVRHCKGAKNVNLTKLVKYVQTLTTTQRVRRKSNTTWVVGDHAIRAIVKDRLGIIGRPGRKPSRL